MKKQQTLRQKWNTARNWATKGAITRIITRLEVLVKSNVIIPTEREHIQDIITNLKAFLRNMKYFNIKSWSLYKRRMKDAGRK